MARTSNLHGTTVESCFLQNCLSTLQNLNQILLPVKNLNFLSIVKMHGCHKPGKHGKPGKLRELEKLSKSQGKLKFYRKNLENSEKCRICGIIANGNVFQRIILFGIPQGKV